MPKIYGSVIHNHGILKCKKCGFEWRANEQELNDIANGRKVTCIFCRAMNEIRVGQILPKNVDYKLGSYVQCKDPSELRGDNYQDKKVSVIHNRCKHSFEVKLIDIRQGSIECPFCKNAKKQRISEDTSTRSGSDKGLTELIVDTPKIDVNTSNRLPAKIDEKKLGDVYYSKTRLMDIDQKAGTYTTQCIKCGAEEVKDLHMLKKRGADKEKLMLCSICGSSNSISIPKLKHDYIGKIYNGMRIEDVYQNEDGITVCDLVCMQNKRSMNLNEYINALTSKDRLTNLSYQASDKLHVQLGVPLGDVINKRVSCLICGKQKLAEAYRFKPYLTCPNFSIINKNSRKTRLNLEGITVGDFYNKVNKQSLCGYCTARDICEFADKDPRVSLSVISSMIDIQDSMVSDMLKVNAEYPGMFEFKGEDASNIGIKPEKDLLIIKDAYIGRDGKLYKTCKCTKHETEMILSDSEIANFEHSQCNRNNVYMRFFDIKRIIYLK